MRCVLQRSPARRAGSALANIPRAHARSVWKPAGFAPKAPADADADRAQARAFVEARGYHPALATAIVDELESPQWNASSAGGVLSLATRLAGRWEVGEDGGLSSLAAAVERARAASEGKQRIRFQVQPAQGAVFDCESFEGMSLKEVAEHADNEASRLLAEHLECACSGVMACSTCHVYIAEPWMDSVGIPSEEEEDMLDLAYERQSNSRLGCQVVLTPELDGLRIIIPKGANNLFDHIPFE
jgi:ferredoxin